MKLFFSFQHFNNSFNALLFCSSFFAVCKRKAIEKRLVRFKGLKNAFAFLFLRKAFKKSSGMDHLALCIICFSQLPFFLQLQWLSILQIASNLLLLIAL
jgi:hypothetical protein